MFLKPTPTVYTASLSLYTCTCICRKATCVKALVLRMPPIHHTAYLCQCTLPCSRISTQHNLSIGISREVIAYLHHLIKHTKGCVLGNHHGCTSFIVLDVDINARMGEKCSYTAGFIFPCSLMKSSISILVEQGTVTYFIQCTSHQLHKHLFQQKKGDLKSRL